MSKFKDWADWIGLGAIEGGDDSYAEFAERVKDGPPCARCAYWNPEMRWHTQRGFDGVRLCTRHDGPEPDFSCFEAKEPSHEDWLRTVLSTPSGWELIGKLVLRMLAEARARA